MDPIGEPSIMDTGAIGGDYAESVPNSWWHIYRSIRHFEEERYVSTFSNFRNLLVIESWMKSSHAWGEGVPYRLRPVLMDDFNQILPVPWSGDVTAVRKNVID